MLGLICHCVIMEMISAMYVVEYGLCNLLWLGASSIIVHFRFDFCYKQPVFLVIGYFYIISKDFQVPFAVKQRAFSTWWLFKDNIPRSIF
jgi:hypothetical protein